MRGMAMALPILTIAALLPIALSGCGGGPIDPGGPPPPATAAGPMRSPSPTTHPTGSPLAGARKAYLAMWAAYVAASQTADYQSAILARYAAGAALSVLTHALYASHQDGIVTRGKPSFDPSFTIVGGSGAVDARQAKVTDCADTATWTSYTTSGKRVPDQPLGRRRITAIIQLLSEAGATAWKVTYLNVGAAATC